MISQELVDVFKEYPESQEVQTVAEVQAEHSVGQGRQVFDTESL